jgi:hypothetical protein|tara:strand:- start:3354 stop:3545 length:192 start_codon:yes stop_codon:yes gene_type:complete
MFFVLRCSLAVLLFFLIITGKRERERESVFTIAKRENKKNDRRTTITLLQPLKAPGIHAEFFV